MQTDLRTQPQEEQSQQQESPYDTVFLLTLAIIFLIVTGSIFLIFGVTYIKDLQTLRDVPNLLWNFACGRPIDTGFTLPLLLSISIASFAGSGLLYGIQRWLRGRSSPNGDSPTP